jgi:hypothetical protein
LSEILRAKKEKPTMEMNKRHQLRTAQDAAISHLKRHSINASETAITALRRPRRKSRRPFRRFLPAIEYRLVALFED